MTVEDPIGEVVAPTALPTLPAIDPLVLEMLPTAACLCTADGSIAAFNSRATELWGRTPLPGDPRERYCGAIHLFEADGRPMPHARGPLATALRTGLPQRDREVTMERPDGRRIVVLAQVEPLVEAGRVVGAINCFHDITERKRAEQDLRSRYADLEDFFENAVVPMHWVGGDGTILRANRAELDLLGYAEEEYVGRHIADFHADRGTIDAILLSLSQGLSLRKAEARLRAKDGAIKEVLISSSAQLRDGGLVHTRCVTLDVTGDRQAEAALRDSERRSRELLEALPVAIYTTDIAGRITYYNPAAAELWGRRPELHEDRWCGALKLFRPDGTPLPHEDCPMALALRERQPVRGMEAVAERPDGSRIPFIPFPTLLRDGSGAVVGAVNMLVDITDRKRGERAQQQLAAIVESSIDAIVSKDLNGTVASWNPAAESLFGYPPEEVVGKSITIVIPSARRDEEARILDRIRRGLRVEPFDTVRRRKDGSFVEVSITVSPVKDMDGQVVGASKIARDITDRRRAERALERSMEELGALYRFTDSMHRAHELEEVYDSALETIIRALHCQRASILLFDQTGVMRFVAWRGLSEGYRRATDGHSPWTPDTREPQPICFQDVAAADLDEQLRATIRKEGIGALAFIPLVAGGTLVGKFMAYYDAPHRFTEGDLELAVTIARQLGFSVGRMRAEEARRAAEKELRESEARERANAAELQTIMGAVPAVIWIARDRECRVVAGNPYSHDLLRLPRDSNLSLTAPTEERPRHFKVFADGREVGPDELPVQRAARGEEVRNFEHETRFEDGTSRYLFGNATPLRDAQGRPRGAVAAFVDITERRKAEEQRDLLIAELNHRVKNTLATVISIARQSLSRAESGGEAYQSFSARIRALAQTHGRLAEASWSGVSFEALLQDEFAPYRRDDGSNVRIRGPLVTLSPKAALMLGMTFHELATNAAKYGALSSKGGAVDIGWQIDPRDRQVLRIDWAETGGPSVRKPDRSGFGRMLLERALAADLGGDVQLDFAEDGLRCAISIPLQMNVAQVA